jgi:hypothetical protein
MADGTEEAEAVGEAVGDVTATVVADAIEGAGARADAAQETAEAIADAALATAQGHHIEQVERDTWREIAQLREQVERLEAKHVLTEEQLSTWMATQLSLSADQQTQLIAMLATQSTPLPPPTPPEPEASPSVNPADADESPAESPAPEKRRRHRFL